MNLSTPYGIRFVWAFDSDDGYAYRVEVRRAGYSGPTRDVGGSDCSITWAGSGGDALDTLAPVAGSEMRMTLLDDVGGFAGEVEGSPDGAWAVVLYRAATPDAFPDPDDAVEWVGYMLAARRDEREVFDGVTATTLTFVDGIGLLGSRPWGGRASRGVSADGTEIGYATDTGTDDAEPVLRSILRTLGPLGGGGTVGSTRDALPLATWGEVRTAVQWWPRVAEAFGAGDYTQLPGDVDPLAYICTRAAVWFDANRESTKTDATLRAICHRFCARLYQSEGVWRLDQRGLLARDATAVPVHAYGITGGAGGNGAFPGSRAAGGDYDAPTTSEDWGYDPTPSAATPEDRVVDLHDTPGLSVVVGDARGSALAVRTVESTYGHGELGNLVVNGSFETARPGSPLTDGVATQADAWTQGTDVVRYKLTPTSRPGFSPVIDDQYALRLGNGRGPGDPYVFSSASQALPLALGATPSNRVLVKAAMLIPGIVFSTRPQAGGIKLECVRPDGSAVRTTDMRVRLGSNTLAGKDALVFLTTEAMGGADTPVYASDDVLIPEGTVLSFGRPTTSDPDTYESDPVGTVTLKEPLLAGSERVRADVSLGGEETEGLLTGDTAYTQIWTSALGRASVGTGLRPFGVFPAMPVTMWLSGSADDGRPVEGMVKVYAEGVGSDVEGFASAIDDIEVSLQFAPKVVRGTPVGSTQEPTETTGRAMRPAGSTGTDASLPLSGAGASDYAVGDGPLPGSDGALVVLSSRNGTSLEEVPTATGDASGDWSLVPYDSEEESTGLGIEGLAASEALRGAGWRDPVTNASGPLARGQDTVYMRRTPGGGDAPRLRPHHVPRRWLPASLVSPATIGAETVVLTKPVRAAEFVRLTLGADPVEVVSVEGGAGGWVATLAEPITAALPANSPVRYSLLTWWDSHTWDVIRGSGAQDWTELTRDNTTPLILQTALSA